MGTRGSTQIARVVLAGLFLLQALFASVALAQEAVPFMTLGDGTKVTMTQAQFDSLITQPGITYYGPTKGIPTVGSMQMAIPVPSALGGTLGGGYIMGEPGAIAAAMNAVGMTSAATGSTVVTAKAGAGSITAGAGAAGAAAAGGVGAGTILVGAGILAALAGAALAGGGGGGGGGGGAGGVVATPAHH